jgi:hypothetical protein
MCRSELTSLGIRFVPVTGQPATYAKLHAIRIIFS